MEQRIDIINNWSITRLLNEVETGKIRVPRFQRGYVWPRPKVTKLLNSIYLQYPIGTFFFWNASKKLYQNFCRDDFLGIPQNSDVLEYQFILDGQQRLTSLFLVSRGKSLNGTDYSKVYFNLETSEFNLNSREKHNIEVHKLFSPNDFNDVFREYILYDKDNGTNYSDNWQRCQFTFSNYPVSIIRTLNMELDEVVTIFERINQGGKRLTVFDIFHASTWSEKFDLRKLIREFNNKTSIQRFGTIKNEVFLHSLALNAVNSCTNKNALKLDTDTSLKHWSKTIKSIELALDYLKNFGVLSSSFLPYGAIISVLQHYFFVSESNAIRPQHKQVLEQWFWTSSFSKRYGSSTQGKIDQDGKWIRSLVQGEIIANKFPVFVAEEDLLKLKRGRQDGVATAIFCLMALQAPRDFSNSNQVALDNSHISKLNSKEHHHIFPKSQKKNFDTKEDINLLVNFALISSQQNKEISNKLPSVYLSEYIQSNKEIDECLLSHYIDEKAKQAMLNDNYDEFISYRAESILLAIKEKVE